MDLNRFFDEAFQTDKDNGYWFSEQDLANIVFDEAANRPCCPAKYCEKCGREFVDLDEDFCADCLYFLISFDEPAHSSEELANFALAGTLNAVEQIHLYPKNQNLRREAIEAYEREVYKGLGITFCREDHYYF
jgi:hypothetical protein